MAGGHDSREITKMGPQILNAATIIIEIKQLKINDNKPVGIPLVSER